MYGVGVCRYDDGFQSFRLYTPGVKYSLIGQSGPVINPSKLQTESKLLHAPVANRVHRSLIFRSESSLGIGFYFSLGEPVPELPSNVSSTYTASGSARVG
jgi:hypothetical protein